MDADIMGADVDNDVGMDLPAVFVTAEGERITGPVYRLAADGYYGDTLYLAEEIIITDLTPNHHFEPLNQAAADCVRQWLASLPLSRENLRDEDLVEASYMLRPREGVPEMTHQQFATAVIKLATQLKLKREGGGRVLPEPQVRPLSRGPVAPMGHAQFTDQHAGMMAQQGPVQRAAVAQSHRAARRAGRPALSGAPSPDPAPGQV